MATRHATLIWLIFAQFGFISSNLKKMIRFTYASAPLTRIIVISELSFTPRYFCSFTKTHKNMHTDAHGNIYAHNIYPTGILVNLSTVELSIIVEICCFFLLQSSYLLQMYKPLCCTRWLAFDFKVVLLLD